jgi:uncharacterized membrane protein
MPRPPVRRISTSVDFRCAIDDQLGAHQSGRVSSVTFEQALDLVVRGFEAFGVGILVVGSLVGIVGYARDVRRMDRTKAYVRLRANIGRTILLGLEVLIVADIVLTVAIDSTIESAVTLGIIVLVRTFLSFSLEIELDGVVPWRRRAVEAAGSSAGDLTPSG